MSLAQTLAEDRRGIVLCALDEAGGSRLAEGSVKSVLDALGHRISSDQVRADLHWLEEQGLLRVERVPAAAGGEVWMAQLLDSGQDVARGVRHPGVRRQAPKR